MAIKTFPKGSKEKLSNNFYVSEFACHGNGCCGIVMIDDKLVAYLQQIRDHFGKPITINSGYRCSTHNKNIGGASNSYHTKGMAADIVVDGVAPAEVAKYAESIGVLGIGLYETAKDGYFVHIDTRTTKAFWYGHAEAHRDTFGGAPSEPVYDHATFLKELQEALGAPVTGKPDLVTMGMTVTVSAKINSKHAVVKPLQKWLKALSYEEIGTTDGVAGAMFASALARYQQEHDCTPSGIAEEWGKTWHKIIFG